MMMRHQVLLAAACLAVLSLAACAPDSSAIERPAYTAVPLKGDPVITFRPADDNLLIDVTSPTGIGSAAIEKTVGQWPSQVTVRLHVTGLESFKFRYADTTIDVSVSSHGDNAVREEATTSGALQAGDPEWLAVTPGEGYFDLEAPADFLKSGENKFTIEWIDFYR
jgi:hypothetical protein